MMGKLFFEILFSVMISLSVASNWNTNSRICTKLVLNKFYIYRFDKNIHRVVSDEKIRKRIIFVCCEGYRERSRNKELPNCEPICKQSCGYGYCYGPNSCACYYGYEISSTEGTCKRIGVGKKAISPTVDTAYTVTSSTVKSSRWQHFDKKSSYSTVVPDLKKSAGFESTTIRPEGQGTEFEKESTTEQIGFPRVKFITYADTDLGTTSLRSTPRTSSKIESSTKQIELGPSLGTSDDFPRVKFISHRDSLPNTRSRNQSLTRTKNLEVESYESANCSMGICTCQMGYQLINERFCIQCQFGRQCQCQGGYAFDSFRCKPLCNGVFDGCIGGTCIGYNECSCLNGTEKLTGDKFRCYVKEVNGFNHRKIDTKWCLLLLVIPAVVVVVSFYFILKRSRSSKSNRLKAQRHHFQEIRYFYTNNNCCEQNMSYALNGSGLGGPGNQLNENILIVKE